MRDSLPEVGWFMLPPANVGERPRTGPVDCLCLIIAGRARDMDGQALRLSGGAKLRGGRMHKSEFCEGAVECTAESGL